MELSDPCFRKRGRVFRLQLQKVDFSGSSSSVGFVLSMSTESLDASLGKGEDMELVSSGKEIFTHLPSGEEEHAA